MSVTPGRGGQDFILETVDKLKKISKDRNYLVSVDGGINDKTIKHVKKYVDIVVSGNYIISSSDIETAIEKLR